MPIPTPESAIQRAILAVQAGESERAVSKRLKVPRATLRDRIRGRPTRTESKESARTLSSTQEEYLETWAIRQAQLGLAPKHNVFRLFVARLLKTDQPALPFGIHWQQWFPDRGDDFYDLRINIKDWLFACSPKGWTNNELAMVWLRNIYLPRTKPEDPEQWRLLILDGHGSHVQDCFMAECVANKVWLLYLPAHTSHVLQPLDLGPFSVLKRKVRDYLTLRCQLTFNMNVGKADFIWAWHRARESAFKPKVIASGWQATGIYPRDISKPLNSRLRRYEQGRGQEVVPSRPKQPDDQQTPIQEAPTPTSSRQIRHIEALARNGDVQLDGTHRRLLFRQQYDPQDESGEDKAIQVISSDSESDSDVASCIEVEIR
ncbi:hypothetical protein PG994_013428 [Apiospora phragmitis]|uniref:DDE-1 domain-containing protein n=1 Tax=Apiospora phragmitis TaxID=2905665 RepID=A0ABR1T8M3_9PEZI